MNQGTYESISDLISGFQDTFSSTTNKCCECEFKAHYLRNLGIHMKVNHYITCNHIHNIENENTMLDFDMLSLIGARCSLIITLITKMTGMISHSLLYTISGMSGPVQLTFSANGMFYR